MSHRTYDMQFFPCPICGRKPIVEYFPPNSGIAHCEGAFFRGHDAIYAEVKWERPSMLVKTLAHKWNQAGFIEGIGGTK